MDFGAALKDLKAGHQVARKHWGRDRYIGYRPRGRDGYEPHLALHAGPGLDEPWFPTHADLLATNWGRCPNGEGAGDRDRPADPKPPFTLKADGPRITASWDALCTARMLWDRFGITRDQYAPFYDLIESSVMPDADIDEFARKIGRTLSSIDERRRERDRGAP